jgi:hypothetical protein
MTVSRIVSYADVDALSEQTGWSIKSLIALASVNDPFVGDREGGARTIWARWFAELWNRLNIPHGAHLRRIHYVLISTTGVTMPDGKPYLNTYNHWKDLGDAATDVRAFASRNAALHESAPGTELA